MHRPGGLPGQRRRWCRRWRGGLTPSQHDAGYQRVQGLGPTTDMPTTGTASYAGCLKADLYQGAGSTPNGTMLGDIAMTMDFAKSGDAQGVTGEISNIRGKIGTDDVTYDGKLTTADARAKGLPNTVTVTSSTITVPPPGSGTLTTSTGALMAHFTGDLAVDGQAGAVVVQTGGVFFGGQGAAVTGPVSGTWWGPTGPKDYTLGGTWFADKQ